MHRRSFITLIAATLGPRPAADSSPVAGIRDPGLPQGHPAPDVFPEEISPLEAWLRLPIQPLWRIPEFECYDAPYHPFYQILSAIRRNEVLKFSYLGGTHPGKSRTITPALVFRKIIPGDTTPDHQAPLYLLAWCHTRMAHRTFRLDRMKIPAEKPSLSALP